VPKQKLASLSVDALLRLRDDIGEILSRKAADLQRQLARLGGGANIRNGRRRSTKGRKVAPKYRGPNGETWAGRGARPRWMQEAMKQGKKPDDFLIAKRTVSRRKSKKFRKRKAA